VKPFTVAISSFFAFAFVVTVKAQTPAFTRTDFHVASTDGVRVFVREVTSGEPTKGKVAVILLHGARVPGLASFDLEVANGSLAEEIAGTDILFTSWMLGDMDSQRDQLLWTSLRSKTCLQSVDTKWSAILKQLSAK
jgi:hypothetical protein